MKPSYFVTRSEPGKPPIIGRATSPKRAYRLAARYRAIPAVVGTTIDVEGDVSGVVWKPWVYGEHGWVRGDYGGPRR